MYKSYDSPTFHFLEIYNDDGVGMAFKVNSAGVLAMLKSKSAGCANTDISIPDILPDGTHIVEIGRCCVKGSFRKITVSDNIRVVQKEAFRNVSAEEIVWPASCIHVPNYCFFNSSVKKISNLNNIDSIGICAFSNIRNLSELDLSASPICFISSSAFNGLSNVRLPYYCQ